MFKCKIKKNFIGHPCIHNNPYFSRTYFRKLFLAAQQISLSSRSLFDAESEKAGFDLAINFILILIPLSLEHPFLIEPHSKERQTDIK
jgi:hypothetical protein